MISLPRDDLEKQKILRVIVRKFEDGKIYPEQEVNEIIKSFDVDDHVLIRRELVNFNYLAKDSYKGTYWLKTKQLSQEQFDKIGSRGKKISEME
jgi:hypothetical protein